MILNSFSYFCTIDGASWVTVWSVDLRLSRTLFWMIKPLLFVIRSNICIITIWIPWPQRMHKILSGQHNFKSSRGNAICVVLFMFAAVNSPTVVERMKCLSPQKEQSSASQIHRSLMVGDDSLSLGSFSHSTYWGPMRFHASQVPDS